MSLSRCYIKSLGQYQHCHRLKRALVIITQGLWGLSSYRFSSCHGHPSYYIRSLISILLIALHQEGNYFNKSVSQNDIKYKKDPTGKKLIHVSIMIFNAPMGHKGHKDRHLFCKQCIIMIIFLPYLWTRIIRGVYLFSTAYVFKPHSFINLKALSHLPVVDFLFTGTWK